MKVCSNCGISQDEETLYAVPEDCQAEFGGYLCESCWDDIMMYVDKNDTTNTSSENSDDEELGLDDEDTDDEDDEYCDPIGDDLDYAQMVGYDEDVDAAMNEILGISSAEPEDDDNTVK